MGIQQSATYLAPSHAKNGSCHGTKPIQNLRPVDQLYVYEVPGLPDLEEGDQRENPRDKPDHFRIIVKHVSPGVPEDQE